MIYQAMNDTIVVWTKEGGGKSNERVLGGALSFFKNVIVERMDFRLLTCAFCSAKPVSRRLCSGFIITDFTYM